jgi:[ribosomal protein S18]-alanine N-acetyltransferase
VTYELRPLTAEHGEVMAQWRYPGPWAVYDLTGPLDPAQGFWSVLDENGEVAGFACFGLEARVPGVLERPGVLDVGVGLRPELTGQGRGREFAEAVLAHGQAVSGIGRLRAVVQEWNARSRRLLAGLGFVEMGRHFVGEVEYVIYERDA